MLTGSDSRAPNLINTEHLNTKHAPSNTDFGLGLLLSQTTHSPVAFKMFHMGSFLQVKPCTEAPNLYSIDKIKVYWVNQVEKQRLFPVPPPLSSSWCLRRFCRALELLWNTVRKRLTVFSWSLSTDKVASSRDVFQLASKTPAFLVASRISFEILHWEFQVSQILSIPHAHRPSFHNPIPSSWPALLVIPK